MRSGRQVPIAFNQSFSTFPPKGSKPNDSFEVVRAAEDTRPLGLKNTDNRIVAGTLVHTLRASSQKSTHRTQRGFVPGRQLTHNVLDLDSAGRVLGMRAMIANNKNLGNYSRRLIAILAFFDFCAAFPSVAHGWIGLVLHARDFPAGIRDFIIFLYSFMA